MEPAVTVGLDVANSVFQVHGVAATGAVTAIRFEDHIRSAGFFVTTVPNQGKGAALKRVEAGRRLFPAIWFNAEPCSPGLDALGWYHEKHDEARNIGLGPQHDWASHGADAFGMMCVAYEAPNEFDDDEDDRRQPFHESRSATTGY